MRKVKKRMLFIYNPYAGRSKIRLLLSSIIELFVENGFEVVTYSTLKAKDATRIVQECLGRGKYDILVCSGGDGTLNEVISGVLSVGKEIEVGYIPAGTTNDYAYSLGLPKNIMASAKIVLDGQPFLCDIGNLNGQYFSYTAAFGIFTDASYETPQTTKNTLGRLAYILEGIKRLPKWKSHHIRITCGERVVEDNFIYGMVTNSSSVGGFKGITGKDVLLDDGLFEGVFIKAPQNVLDIQTIINDLLHVNIKSKHIFFLPVKEMSLVSRETISWTLDGEYGGKFKKVQIKNLKKAIPLIRKKKNK